jgi:N-acyl amino acid synthase of PEP-CTERM/exosortase system
LSDAYRLRFQVYCREHGYENPDDFPDGRESDRYDARAMQTLLIHRSSQLVAGTVRLILPDPDRPVGSLPVDQLCQEPVLRDERSLPRSKLAEVSRFAVSKDFRKRLEDAQVPSGIGDNWRELVDGRRRIPHLSLGLIQGLVRNSCEAGIEHWVAEMEPALLRMLRHIGIRFTNMGPIVEFHGRRQPCYIHIQEMLARVERERPDVWSVITADGTFC